jgi:hypothetical protein
MTEYSGYRNVMIIHPETGNLAEVPDTALRQHYQAGWVPLAPDNGPGPKYGDDHPKALSRREVAEGLATRAAELRAEADQADQDSPASAGGSKADHPAKGTRAAAGAKSSSASEE